MLIHIIYIALFSLGGITAQYDKPCNRCVCYYIDSYIALDCVNRTLYSLPVLDESDAIIVKIVYIMDNYISMLDIDILNKWVFLSYIDITNNPVPCTELQKIRQDVTAVSTCIPENSEYHKPYILILRFSLFLTHLDLCITVFCKKTYISSIIHN